MPSAISQIVPVNVTIGSITPTTTSFGVPMIAAQFAPTKTTTTFGRVRSYTSLAALVADGWLVTDQVYLAAQDLLSANPQLATFVVGRNDSGDANWTAALTAIQAATTQATSWYAFIIVPVASVLATVISEQLLCSAWAEANGNPFFMDSNDATILAAGSTDAGSQVSANARNYTVVTYHNPAVATASATVTLGASQAVATVATAINGVVTLTFGAAFVAANNIAGTVNGQAYSVTYATSDAATFLALAAAIGALTGTVAVANVPGGTYATRSITIFSSVAGVPASGEFASASLLGDLLPQPIGSYNPAYGALPGSTVDSPTVAQKSIAWGKFVNTYTSVSGVNIYERGFVAGGNFGFIDVTFGKDWIVANIQTAILTLLAGSAAVPFTVLGASLIHDTIAGVLKQAATMGIINTSYNVVVPPATTLTTGNRTARTWPGITFSAQLQGAVNVVQISGTVSF